MHGASRCKGHVSPALTLPPHILCSFSFRGVHFFSLLTRRPPPAGFSSSPKASSTDEPSCFMNLVHAVKTLFEEGCYSSCTALDCLGSSQQAGPCGGSPEDVVAIRELVDSPCRRRNCRLARRRKTAFIRRSLTGGGQGGWHCLGLLRLWSRLS